MRGDCMKDIVIFSRGIANNLLDQGYILKHIGQDKQNRKASVFYFENTQCIKDYLAVKFDIIIK